MTKRPERILFHVKQFVRRWFIMFVTLPLIIGVYHEAGYATAVAIYLIFFMLNIHKNAIDSHLDSHIDNAIMLVRSIQNEIAVLEKHINEQNGQREQ